MLYARDELSVIFIEVCKVPTMSVQQINLFQPMFRREKKMFTFAALRQVSLILVLAFLAVSIYGVASNYRLGGRIAAQQRAQAEKQAALSAVEIKQVGHDEALSAEEELSMVRNEYQARQALAQLMGAQDRLHVYGFSAYLAAFSQKMLPGMWLTRFSVSGDGSGLELRGGTMEPALLPEFVQSLHDVPALAEMQFRLLQMEREDSGSRWLEFVLNTANSPLEYRNP